MYSSLVHRSTRETAGNEDEEMTALSSSLSERTARSSPSERTARSSPSMVDPLSKVFTPGGLPERDAERENRGEFQSTFQYILTCIGYAVGLGNIWRFPALAYENGGGAFLIPYLCCAALFGLPILYMELVVGQFTQSGSSIAFRHYFPLLQGLGWASGVMSISIAFFYNVIVAWAMLYMFHTVSGGVNKWGTCTNTWNTADCRSLNHDTKCTEGYTFFNNSRVSSCLNASFIEDNANATFFFGFNVTDTNNETIGFNETYPANETTFLSTIFEMYTGDWTLDGFNLTDASFPSKGPLDSAEEFFVNHVLRASTTAAAFNDWGSFNYPIGICLLLAWILATLGLWKGVKVLGKLSLVTATTPYIIIAILFGYAVSLDGAITGIEFYLLKPDFGKILRLETWRAALCQACFSLSIGIGGMLTLASYNKRSHPCYRDALIICGADSFMSVFGGIAVFSVLGFISKQLQVDIEKVVQSGVYLAFVAYPVAFTKMFCPALWSMLFFMMLFFLGLSTMFGYLEGFICCITDQFPSLRPKRTLVMVCVSTVCCCCSSIFCFSGGIHWFQVLNDFIGAFALCVVIIGEIVLINFCYGPCRFFRDIEAMFGRPRNWFKKIFGPSGWYIRATQLISAPILALVVLVASFNRSPLTFGKGEREFAYPGWVTGIGWAIGIFPVLFIPLFAIINIIQFKRSGQSLIELVTLQQEHPAVRYELKDQKWSLKSYLTAVRQFISNRWQHISNRWQQNKAESDSVRKSTRSQKSQRNE